jgi:tetratricopeptide (TPR) repeat protein
MASVSKLSLALALGLGGLMSVPTALVAKEPKPAATPAPQLSAPFRKAIAEVQTATKAGNAADAQAKLVIAEPLATMPDEKYFVAVMTLEIAKLTKDRATTRKAVEGLIASQSKLVTNMPELYYNSGALAYDAGEYPLAATRLAEADRLGSKDINRLLLGAEANFKTGQTAAGLAILRRAIAEQSAAGTKPPQDWYRRALSVSMKSKLPGEIASWSRDLVKAYPTPTNWRDAIVLYRDGSKLDPLVQLDIFRLMREVKALAGEKDFYDYAEVANNRALPAEAKAVIDEGYASGAASRSSRPIAEMLTLANSKLAGDAAAVAADERRARAASDGKLAGNIGNAYVSYGNYEKAIDLLRFAATKPGADLDAVNTRLGIALTKSGQKAEARKVFSSVNGQRVEIARFWMLYLDLNP